MAQDEAEEERAFLADLKARTGRDLAEWMAAITAQGHADKNETIDWLRAQGLPFARASWLERIHSNGGRPIYGQHGTAQAEVGANASAPSKSPQAHRAPTQREIAQIEKLLATAKGYRPLYHLLEAEIRRAVPGVQIGAKSTYISLGAPAEFAAVALQATELRLGLDLGDLPFDLPLQQARLRGVGPSITHMLVLTDARQVNAELLRFINVANTRVNA